VGTIFVMSIKRELKIHCLSYHKISSHQSFTNEEERFQPEYKRTCSCSCQLGEIVSLNCVHQWTYCSYLRWYMSVESHSGAILTRKPKDLDWFGTGLISWVPRLPLWISFYCGSPLIISPGGCLLEASLQRHSLTPSTWTTMTAPRMENIFLYNKSTKLNISFYIHTYVGAGVAQSVYCLAIDWTTGRLRFDPWQRKEIFLLTYVSRPARGPT
jgi:hypothetical protein